MKQRPAGPATVFAAASLTLANRALLVAGLRSRRDGWRRAAGLALRDTPSTFILGTFGLSSGSASHLEGALHEFFRREPAMHTRVRIGTHEDVPERSDAPEYTLATEAWRDGPRRFVRPETWEGARCGSSPQGAGASLGASAPTCNVIVREHGTLGVDVWIRFNHIAIDGAEAQEIVSRLTAVFSPARPVVFPDPDEFAVHSRPMPAGREGVSDVQGFFDFAPLLAWRARVNASLPTPMTLAGAMIWNLARTPELESRIFGTTVDTPATGQPAIGRGVGIVVIRPADYVRRRDALPRFVRDFTAQLERSRRRATSAWRTLDASALVPAPLAGALLRHALTNIPSTFGEVGLTMLKDAPVFGAPFGDAGHPAGFFAVGNVALPAIDAHGRAVRVGCINAKGPTPVVAGYPELLRGMFERLRGEMR